jgi:hypothetical protein
MIGSLLGDGFLPAGLWLLTSAAVLLVWGLVIWATVGLLGQYEARARKGDRPGTASEMTDSGGESGNRRTSEQVQPHSRAS